MTLTNNENKNINLCKWLSFLMVIVIRIIVCAQALPIRTLSDELATISGAAYFAGYDWSTVVSNAGYYGVGFTSLLSVIFRIFDDPVIIYRSMLIACALLQSIPVFIVFYIAEKHCKIDDHIFISLVAIASSFFVLTRATIVYNEHVLICISWIVVYLLFKLIENMECISRKRWYTLLLILCLTYALTIHTRAITLWIALFVTFVIYAWCEHKMLISPLVGIIVGGIGYILSQKYVDSMQMVLWVTEAGETLRNASIQPLGSLSSLLSVEKWTAWLDIIMGQLNTINIFSGGLIALILPFFIYSVWKNIIKDTKYIANEKKNGLDIFVPVIVFFGLCVCMTILAQSMTWLTGAAKAIAEGVHNNNYGTKAFTYVRYFGPYCGPLFMIGCFWIHKELKNIDKIMHYYKIGLAITMILSVYWVLCVVPYIHQTSSTNVLEVLIPFSFSNVMVKNAKLRIILPATIVVMGLYMSYGILLKKKKWNIVIELVCVLLIYQYIYNAVYWDFPVQERNYSGYGYDVREYITEIENKKEIEPVVYVQDVRDVSDHYIYYEIQFMLYDYKIIPIQTIEDLPSRGDVILITNQSQTVDLEEYTEQGYKIDYINEKLMVLVRE